MSNELTTLNNNSDMWKNPQSVKEIKDIFAKNLTDAEFKFFISLGMHTGLNPFTREIWAVKYGDKTAQIFIGRDGYRKIAMLQSDYDYHYTDCVYEKDIFKVKAGLPEHEYSHTDRGQLVGAYCIVKRKGSSQPLYNYVSFREYDLKQALWKDKPETMIKKVAESQTLRMAFPNLFNGTYDESEQWVETKEPVNVTPKSAPANNNNNNKQQDFTLPVQSEQERKLMHAVLKEYKLDKDQVKEYLIDVGVIKESTKEIAGDRLKAMVESIKSGKFLATMNTWIDERN